MRLPRVYLLSWIVGTRSSFELSLIMFDCILIYLLVGYAQIYAQIWLGHSIAIILFALKFPLDWRFFITILFACRLLETRSQGRWGEIMLLPESSLVLRFAMWRVASQAGLIGILLILTLSPLLSSIAADRSVSLWMWTVSNLSRRGFSSGQLDLATPEAYALLALDIAMVICLVFKSAMMIYAMTSIWVNTRLRSLTLIPFWMIYALVDYLLLRTVQATSVYLLVPPARWDRWDVFMLADINEFLSIFPLLLVFPYCRYLWRRTSDASDG